MLVFLRFSPLFLWKMEDPRLGLIDIMLENGVIPIPREVMSTRTYVVDSRALPYLEASTK